MNAPDPDFDNEVKRCFLPLANRASLSLQKLKEGVFEMSSHGFALRVRSGIGHARDFVVTLAKQSSLSKNYDELTGEIGLGNFAEVHGEKLELHPLHTPAGYHHAFEEAASLAGKLCVPYLIGVRGDADFEKVCEHVDRKKAEAGDKWKDYKFTKNVRKEWL
jgi:hypothetical protein